MIKKSCGVLVLCALSLVVHTPSLAAEKAQFPENAVLEKFVGSWKGDIEITTADGKTSSQNWRNAFSWTLNGRFLKDEGGDVKGTSSFLGLWSWDPQSKRFKSWYFLGPGGEAVNLAYTWNEKSQTLKGSADLGGGMTITTEDRFIDKDRYFWSTVITDKDGKTVQRLTGNQTRI